MEEILSNPNIFYVETKYGNHFGFYEGYLWEMFSSKTCYSYPAKLVIEFFGTLLEKDEPDMKQS
jgi:predicted alpha/beta-fold hydrolase